MRGGWMDGKGGRKGEEEWTGPWAPAKEAARPSKAQFPSGRRGNGGPGLEDGQRRRRGGCFAAEDDRRESEREKSSN